MFSLSFRRPRSIAAAFVLSVALVCFISFSLAMPSQAAEATTATPDDNLATAQRSADEAKSLYWAASARLLQKENDPFTALALALEANRIPSPPDQAVRTLEDIAYAAPSPRRILAKNPSNPPYWDVHWKADYRPDGKLIVAANEYEKDLYLFDAVNGQVLRHFEGHRSTISGVSFSPDGSKILSNSIDTCTGCDYVGSGHELILWDVQSGKQIWKLTEETTTADFYDPSFSPDGQRILTRGFVSNQLIEWSAKDGTEIQRFGGTNTAYIGHSIFSPDGSQILSMVGKNDLILWDSKTLKEIRRFNHQMQSLYFAAFTPDGNSILVSGNRDQLKLLDVATGQVKKYPILQETAGVVNHIAFDADSKRFLTSTTSGDLILWDFDTGNQLKISQANVDILTISPNRHQFLSDNGDLVLWDVDKGQVIRGFSGHSGRVQNMAFSPDGTLMASVSDNQELILWNAKTGEMIYQLLKPSRTSANKNVVFSPDSKLVASTDETGFITLWDTHTGKVIRSIKEGANEVAFSPDGRSLLSGGRNNDLVLWDVDSGLEKHRYIYNTSETEWQHVAFSPNGEFILSTDTKSNTVLWHIASGEIVRQWPETYIAVLSPDGRNIVYQDLNSDLVFEDLISRKIVQSIGRDQFAVQIYVNKLYNLRAIKFSPDGHQILVTDFGGNLTIFDVASAKALWRLNTYAQPAIFSPDGHSILTIDSDIVSYDGMLLGRDMVLLRIDNLDKLIQWTLANRAVGTLSCDQRAYYGVMPLCSADEASMGTPPATLPFNTSTLTPIPITSTNEGATLTHEMEETGTAVDLLIGQPTVSLTPSNTATATAVPPTATATSNLAT